MSSANSVDPDQSRLLGLHCLAMSQFWYEYAQGGRVVRWCWVNFQCLGVLLIWIIVGQGPIALAVGAVGGWFGHFFSSLSFLFFLPLWETARYRLKYCLKGPLSPKQPTNQQICINGLRPFHISRAIIWSYDLQAWDAGRQVADKAPLYPNKST